VIEGDLATAAKEGVQIRFGASECDGAKTVAGKGGLRTYPLVTSLVSGRGPGENGRDQSGRED
jgi:hypothetical protein